MLENADVKFWMSQLDLEIHECEQLFQILDHDNSGEISYDEFLAGALRLKGSARSVDIVVILYHINSLLKSVDKHLMGKVDNLTDHHEKLHNHLKDHHKKLHNHLKDHHEK